MVDRTRGTKAVKELAKHIVDRSELSGAPVRMTGSTTASGTTDTVARRDGLPLPLGDPGDVLTVVVDGSDTIAAWETPGFGSVAQEVIEDYVGSLIADSTSIDAVYNDAGNVESLAIKDEYLMDWLGSLIADSSDIDVTYDDSANTFVLSLTAIAKTSTVNFVVDGGGAEITDGIKGDIMVDFAHTIVANHALADQSGSVVIDIWKSTYGAFPPVDAGSITSAAPVTISSALKSEDTTLTGWTVSGAAGSIYRFNVDSCTTIQRCTVALKIVRT